jgi:hypothetical protein
MNRGRVQAQGKKLQESEKWAQDADFYKENGLDKVEKLKQKLTSRDLKARKLGFNKCERFINQAAENNGIRVIDMKKPFLQSFPKNYTERVDLEVHEGIAFINKPKDLNNNEN